MTLYLKYRPQKIDDLDLLEVKELLGKAMKSDQLPHAWLFSGPRGTGKTSSARILAKYVNCLSINDKPCNECEMCLGITDGSNPDIIEMDAASNRGIDEIRELKEKVGLVPMKAKYKVYIIDEAHMLTTEAANALLKTLEEPPSHVLFILCTTEAEKLPDTVISRCVRVQFKRPTLEEIGDKLEFIAKKEKLTLKDGDVKKISEAAKGSFRDAIKILEQVIMNNGELGNVLGAMGTEDPKKFIELVINNKTSDGIEMIAKLVEQGTNLRQFVETCVEELREKIIISHDKNLIGLIEGLDRAYIRMKDSAVVQLPLEIFVIENSRVKEVQSIKESKVDDVVVPVPEIKLKDQGKEYKLDDMTEKWQEVMKAVRPKNHSVEALLRSTRPVNFDGRDLLLEAFYEFHKKQLETEKCRKIIETAVGEVFGVDAVVLKLRLGEAAKKNVEPNITKVNDDELIKAAQEIFK